MPPFTQDAAFAAIREFQQENAVERDVGRGRGTHERRGPARDHRAALHRQHAEVEAHIALPVGYGLPVAPHPVAADRRFGVRRLEIAAVLAEQRAGQFGIALDPRLPVAPQPALGLLPVDGHGASLRSLPRSSEAANRLIVALDFDTSCSWPDAVHHTSDSTNTSCRPGLMTRARHRNRSPRAAFSRLILNSAVSTAAPAGATVDAAAPAV